MLRLALILLAAGVVLVIAVAFIMAWVLLRPPRMTDGKAAWILKRLSPGDLGLTFETLSFDVSDERTGRPLQLAAWWIPPPQPTGRCLLLLHGYGDAKVGAIAWAPMLHELGWGVLAVDLRAHGESAGRQITGGYYERHDIVQVINQFRARFPRRAQIIALMGLSYGAAVAAAAAAICDDVAGVILDSPFEGYISAEMAYCDLMGYPGRFVQRLAMAFYQRLARADLSAIRPSRLVRKIRSPLMLILSRTDPFVPPAAQAVMDAAIRERLEMGYPTAFWWLEDTAHLMAIVEDPALYRQRLQLFLNHLVINRADATDAPPTEA